MTANYQTLILGADLSLPSWIYEIGYQTIITAAVTILAFIFGRSWRTIIVPRLVALATWKGVKITGIWNVVEPTRLNTRAEADGDVDASMELKQVGHRVTGSITWIQKGKTYFYEIEGDYRDTILAATFNIKNDADLDRGAFTVKYIGGGTLKGCFAWYESKPDHTEHIIAGEYVLIRQ